MSELILDRQGRLLETPDFLAPVTERERSIPRFLLMLLGVLLALVASGVAAAIVVVIGVLSGVSLEQQTQIFAGAAGENRHLLSYWFDYAIAGMNLFALAIVLVALAARIYGRPMRTFITAAERFRWGQVGLGVVVALPFVAAAIVAELALGGETVHPPLLRAEGLIDALGYAAIATVFLFLAALAEEMIFRGWLQQQTRAFTRSLPIILLVNGLAFSAIHLDFEPGAFLVRVIMGMGWCWLALRLGGIEFATGAHLANNLALTLLVQPLPLKISSGEPSDLSGVLIQVAIVALTIGVVEYRLRRRREPVVDGG